ncbi:MAG TPA: hypothetical protein DCE23_01350 [Firmicutes bacterium]|nr:hypothetical protein [Bacillota bacterium]
MDRNLFNLDYDYIFNVFNYRNEYKIEKLREEIIDTLDDDKFYINEYGDIMCSIDGAKYIAEYINIDIEPYLDTLRFLNSANFLTEDKIPFMYFKRVKINSLYLQMEYFIDILTKHYFKF